MNTIANTTLGAPYLLSNPLAQSSPRTVPIIIAVAVHVVLILGLAHGLGAIRLPLPATITEAFNVPPEVPQQQQPPEEIKPMEKSLETATLDIPEPPVIAIETDVPVTTESANAITANAVSAPTTDVSMSEVSLVRKTDPQYPPMSKRLNEEGTVVMRLTILAAGRVSNIEMLRSSGFSRLDQAAKDAVRTWVFARREGQPAYTVTVPVKFELKNS